MSDPVKQWLASDLGIAVVEHINKGLWVFPLHGIAENNGELRCTCGKHPCGNAGKHPITAHGFKDAIGLEDGVDPEYIYEQAAELWQYRSDLNVGVATGKKSQIVVIDVDNKNNGEGDESLKRVQEMIGDLPPTRRLITGNGYHLIFDYPEGGLKNGNTYGDDFPGIDTRGDGGYIVIFPSRHHSGRSYQDDPEDRPLLDLPMLHLEFLKRDKKKEKPREAVIVPYNPQDHGRWTPDDVAEMLSFISADCCYDDWYKVGMAIHDGDYPFDLFDKWSASAAHRYPKSGEPSTAEKWKSFKKDGGISMGTVVEWAMKNGWHPKSLNRGHTNEQSNETLAPFLKKLMTKQPTATDELKAPEPQPQPAAPPAPQPQAMPLPEVLKPKKEKPKKEKKEEPKQESQPHFRFDPMQLPGIIGDTIRFIVSTSIYEQPELAFMNIIALCGAVFGRRYASPVDTRTNIYMVGIADTGSGKEHPVKMVESLAFKAGIMNHVGANSIRSDIGLLKALMKNSSLLMNIDEFGMLMQGVTDPRAPYHSRCISAIITKLYSKSGSVYKHGEVADERQKELIISCPNLCIFGTTTESSYIKALRREGIESGELNRFIVIPSRQKPMPKRNVKKKDWPEHIIEWWSQFGPSGKKTLGEIINNANFQPPVKTVEWGECEERQYEIMCEQSSIRNGQEVNKALWTRLYENVVKIAMIFAICRDPENPSMILSDMDWAYSAVTTSIKYMHSLAQEHMADNDIETTHNKVLHVIREAGENGISKADLLKRFRGVRRKEVEELVLTFQDQEEAVIGQMIPTNGRPKTMYFWADTENAKQIMEEVARQKKAS